MAIENSVSKYFWSWFIDSIDVFDCLLSGGGGGGGGGGFRCTLYDVTMHMSANNLINLFGTACT